MEREASYVDMELGRFTALMSPDLVEIVLNPDGGIWIERRGMEFMEPWSGRKSKDEIGNLGKALASEGEIRVGEESPIGSASINYMDWLIRAQVIQAPAVRDGHSISMRFFRSDSDVIEPEYLEGGPMSASKARRALSQRVRELAATDLQAALRLCVTEKLNVVVSGGTSSGKTTVARWLVQQIDPRERILTIEDVPDLMPFHENKVMMVSDRRSPVRSPDKLLQASLRMRPDRIILSEVTGADAYTFLKAINTGHGGSMTTIHADTAELAIERMAQTALEAGSQMTYTDMISYVTRSLDVIVHVGKKGGRRGVLEVFLPQDYADGGAADDL
ncbi:ATPase, T2SS/T4P/T4SS family [Gymnodinialimonas sp. 2305UL16-5]|uniref:ATPase, T2SS/T4P/T4SS family n=1 Tax=Gymnodinialimonas mytili TaxID=3126503 RepID=UPI003095C8DD